MDSTRFCRELGSDNFVMSIGDGTSYRAICRLELTVDGEVGTLTLAIHNGIKVWRA